MRAMNALTPPLGTFADGTHVAGPDLSGVSMTRSALRSPQLESGPENEATTKRSHALARTEPESPVAELSSLFVHVSPQATSPHDAPVSWARTAPASSRPAIQVAKGLGARATSPRSVFAHPRLRLAGTIAGALGLFVCSFTGVAALLVEDAGAATEPQTDAVTAMAVAPAALETAQVTAAAVQNPTAPAVEAPTLVSGTAPAAGALLTRPADPPEANRIVKLAPRIGARQSKASASARPVFSLPPR